MDATSTYNIQAEQEILASIILNNDSILETVERIQPHDFFVEKHRILYIAMLNLYTHNKPIDMITIVEEIKNMESIGGYSYLADLMKMGLSKVKIEDILIVKEKSNMRKLQEMINQAAYDIKENKKSFKDIYNQLQNISNNFDNTDKNLISDEEMIKRTLELIDQNIQNGGGILGIETGIKTLDRAINGLQAKRLYVIAGRPGMGKSALALNICQNISETHKVLYYSMEMGEEEIGIRRLAMRSFLNSTHIERGKLSDDEMKKLMVAMSKVSKGGCVTNCKSNIHVNEIMAQAKKMKLQQGLDMIMVDHIGLLDMKGMGDSLREQTTNICIRLKNLAKDLEIPVILLSQLTRECEKRADKRPMLSDLKESGGIEENADVAMLLYRDEYYNPSTIDINKIECDIAKQRNGRTGKIDLCWKSDYQLVTDIYKG